MAEPAPAEPPSIGIEDTTNHVLFGRGTGLTNHPGNRRMRRIVDKYKSRYMNSFRGDKRTLIQVVYDEIVEGGVKFLKQENDGAADDCWVEVETAVALEKVGQALRGRIRKDHARASKNNKKHQEDSTKGSEEVSTSESNSDQPHQQPTSLTTPLEAQSISQQRAPSISSAPLDQLLRETMIAQELQRRNTSLSLLPNALSLLGSPPQGGLLESLPTAAATASLEVLGGMDRGQEILLLQAIARQEQEQEILRRISSLFRL